MNPTQTTDMEQFSSRKLWQMISEDKTTTPDELEAAIRELAQRRHYLRELEKLGKLTPRRR